MYFLHFWYLFVLLFFFVDVLTPIFYLIFMLYCSQSFTIHFLVVAQYSVCEIGILSLFVNYKADVIVKPVLLLVRQSSVLR